MITRVKLSTFNTENLSLWQNKNRVSIHSMVPQDLEELYDQFNYYILSNKCAEYVTIKSTKGTFRIDGSTSFTPCALSWDIIERAAHSAASRTATTWSEKETKSNGNIWITYLDINRKNRCINHTKKSAQTTLQSLGYNYLYIRFKQFSKCFTKALKSQLSSFTMFCWTPVVWKKHKLVKDQN